MNNRGISTVVATILIILVTIISIVLIWQVLKPTIKESAAGIEAKCVQLDLTIDKETTKCSGVDPVTVTVRLGTIPVSKLVFSFENQDESKTKEVTDVPAIQSKKTYSFAVSELLIINPTKVNVGAYVLSETGETENNCGYIYPAAISC